MAGPVRTAAAVAAGGMIGTLMRTAVGELPLTSAAGTLMVNLVGAALLGFLVGWAPFRAGHSASHAFFGAGVLGGFTTYSALALEAALLPTWSGAGYALFTVAAGVALALGGILCGRRLRTRRVEAP